MINNKRIFFIIFTILISLTQGCGKKSPSITLNETGIVSTFSGIAGQPGNKNSNEITALFNTPIGMTIDTLGNLYVGDYNNYTIRKIEPTGIVTTLAGTMSTPGSTNGLGPIASFHSPTGVGMDTGGNVYVADSMNAGIRKITSTGSVTTFAGSLGNNGSNDGIGTAAQFLTPMGVAVDSVNNVYVADTGNHTIRKITSAGTVTTLAGTAGIIGNADGSGAMAQFNAPQGITVHSSGVLYITDTGNHTLRKITPTGIVTTLSGTPGHTGTADGVGAIARFNKPIGIYINSLGILYISDSLNHTIRKVILTSI